MLFLSSSVHKFGNVLCQAAKGRGEGQGHGQLSIHSVLGNAALHSENASAASSTYRDYLCRRV